jgi:hypothetical protein
MVMHVQFSNSLRASFCLTFIDTRDSLLLIVDDSDEGVVLAVGRYVRRPSSLSSWFNRLQHALYSF